MFEYKQAFDTVEKRCSGEIGKEILKQFHKLSDIQAIECAAYINKMNINDPEDVYVLICGALEDLNLNAIANETKDRLKVYSSLLEAKEDKTDIYKAFKQLGLTQISNKYFTYNTQDKKNMPRQGWILNIAAKDYYDYRRLVLTVVPDLVKTNVSFRVISPNKYTNRLQNVIIIYINNNFNFRDLKVKTQKILLEDVHVHSHKYIFGRISAVFQNFFGTRILDDSGSIVDLADGSVPLLPKNIEAINILNFHQIILKKYADNDNIVQYLQEYLVGIECKREKIFYNVYLISSEDIDKIKQMPIYKDNEDINAICEFRVPKEKTYFTALIVHDKYNEEIERSLIKNNIKYQKLRKSNEETAQERRMKEQKINEAKEKGKNQREERAERDLQRAIEHEQKEKDRIEYEKYENQKQQDISKKFAGKNKKKKKW